MESLEDAQALRVGLSAISDIFSGKGRRGSAHIQK